MKEFTIVVSHPVIVKIQANTYEEAISAIRVQYRLAESEPYDFSLVADAEAEPQDAEKSN